MGQFRFITNMTRAIRFKLLVVACVNAHLDNNWVDFCTYEVSGLTIDFGEKIIKPSLTAIGTLMKSSRPASADC